MRFFIILSYLIPLILPFAYSFSMLLLGVVLVVFLSYCYIKKRVTYHSIQNNTDIDLSNFMKIHFSLVEGEKYIISEEELMIGYKSERLRKILSNNQELFFKISPVLAKKFIYYSGKIFVVKAWMILTIIFSIFFCAIS